MIDTVACQHCFMHFAMRDYEACARTSMPLIDQAKPHELLQVCLVSLYRWGQHRIVEELTSEILAATAPDLWMDTLVRLTLGQIGPDQVLPLISDARSRCQAWFYIGANQRTFGYEEHARRSFDTSIETGVRCTEDELARLERADLAVAISHQRSVMTGEQFQWFSEMAKAAQSALQASRQDDAAQIAREIHDKARDNLEKESLGMAVAMQRTAMIYFFIQEYATARNIFLETKDLYQTHIGARHRLHVECLQQLAATEIALGSVARGEQLLVEKARLTTLALVSSGSCEQGLSQ